MVKYCCVYGCGRNTKTSKNLSYHQIPKEKYRKEEWLKLCGRGDILSKEGKIIERSYVVCSRHFTSKDYIYKKMSTLKQNCKPSLHLPSPDVKAVPAYTDEEETLDHEDVLCNICETPISGIRFKCVSCIDYDLCRACEINDQHTEHFMLRISENLELSSIEKLLVKWREVITKDEVKAVHSSDSSDDDLPITRYKSYDSGVDLSEDVKDTIRMEVIRVLNIKPEELKKKSKKINAKKKKVLKRTTETGHTEVIEPTISPPTPPRKRLKIELDKEQNSNISSAANTAEVVFADVNNIDLKPERTEYLNQPATSSQGTIAKTTPAPQVVLLEAASPSGDANRLSAVSAVPTTLSTLRYPVVQVMTDQRPVMHVKLSDDLTELMVEVTSNNQKTFYKI